MKSNNNPCFLNFKEQLFINKYEVEALLTNLPQLIYMKDLEGNYVLGTKHAEEFVKQGWDSINNIHLCIDNCRQTNNEEDLFVIKNQKTYIKEREIIDINKVPHSYNIYKAPITDINQKLIGIAVMINNTDKEKLLEAQKNTFVASLGHDLKNPTIAQIRALELLLKGQFGDLKESQKEILEMVLDSCRYMSGMLSSLLTTYRTQTGTVKLNYDDFSLIELTDECISEMIYVAKDKNINVIFDKDASNPEISADKVQLKRVIMNLLSNGIKYAFCKSDLKIKVYNKENNICFYFENKSPYISPDKQKSIFARYVSYAEAHKELGIGLGLYTSQKIIEAHEGKIYVQSFKDNRNIFGFEIPRFSACNNKTVCF